MDHLRTCLIMVGHQELVSFAFSPQFSGLRKSALVRANLTLVDVTHLTSVKRNLRIFLRFQQRLRSCGVLWCRVASSPQSSSWFFEDVAADAQCSQAIRAEKKWILTAKVNHTSNVTAEHAKKKTTYILPRRANYYFTERAPPFFRRQPK